MADALGAALAGYSLDCRELPAPSKPHAGEYLVPVNALVAAKLALRRPCRSKAYRMCAWQNNWDFLKAPCGVWSTPIIFRGWIALWRPCQCWGVGWSLRIRWRPECPSPLTLSVSASPPPRHCWPRLGNRSPRRRHCRSSSPGLRCRTSWCRSPSGGP